MRSWKLEEAKNRFSELVRRAREQGPQLVTRRGRDAVVVVSIEEYERLAAPENLFDFLQRSPLGDALESGELEIERPRDFGRDIAL
ncbi:type II toxin-antitoxin system Phd/YefM family antitoxin [soil metagenome]|jgi:prevent-host-death family protein|nr:type II toxin-antitoxin system Phd/YefM family antitoxin [Gemmatimonadota bacterium]